MFYLRFGDVFVFFRFLTGHLFMFVVLYVFHFWAELRFAVLAIRLFLHISS